MIVKCNQNKSIFKIGYKFYKYFFQIWNHQLFQLRNVAPYAASKAIQFLI